MAQSSLIAKVFDFILIDKQSKDYFFQLTHIKNVDLSAFFFILISYLEIEKGCYMHP